MGDSSQASRRTLLTRGALALAALAGAAGVGVLGSRSLSRGSFTLHGSGWHLVAAGRAKGALPAPGETVSLHGRLGGDGDGHFYSSSIFVGAPLGDTPEAASYVETHHFNLADGTIVGSGTWHVGGTSRFAVIGGTGRYAGASGSYDAAQRPLELGGDGSADFVFNLTLPARANGGTDGV